MLLFEWNNLKMSKLNDHLDFLTTSTVIFLNNYQIR